MTEVVVEIGNSHEGSLGIACSMVDMAAKAGAKIVKFQMHLSQFESTTQEPFRAEFSMQDKTRLDYWKRINFSFEDWSKLISYVQNQELEFLCTPFSIEAATWLFQSGGIKRWKVGSGDAVNFPLIDYLISTNLPLIISTGLISNSELITLCKRLSEKNALDRTMLLHCVSQYPATLSDVSLHLLEALRSFSNKVGYSDHSGNLSTSLYAASKGADLIEVHMTPHPDFFGPDVSSSLTPEEIKALIRFIEDLDVMNSTRKSRDTLFEAVTESARIFRKGIYWNMDLCAGSKIEMKHLSFRKPVGQIDAIEIDSVLDKVLLIDVFAGNPANRSEFSN